MTAPMTVTFVDVVVGVALWAGVAMLLVGCLGTVLHRRPWDRLHYVSLTGVVGVPLVVLALALREPSSALKLLLVAVLVAGTGPVVGTAAGRAVDRERRVRDGR